MALVVYLAAVMAVAIWTYAERPPHGLLAFAAASLPAFPVLAAIAATHRYFTEETDRLQRAIQLEALLWATAVTFGVATVWGFLQPLAGAPVVPSYCAFAVFCSVIISVQLARRRFPLAPSNAGLEGQ